MWYVYILKCSDNTFYKGTASNIKDRFERHKKGYIPATKNKLPVKLNNYIAFNDKYKAFEFEKYLKSGSGRAFAKRHFY